MGRAEARRVAWLERSNMRSHWLCVRRLHSSRFSFGRAGVFRQRHVEARYLGQALPAMAGYSTNRLHRYRWGRIQLKIAF